MTVRHASDRRSRMLGLRNCRAAGLALPVGAISALGEGKKPEGAGCAAKPKRIGVARKAAALTCQAGASDNKGRSRVTIAPTKGDQMYLAAGHFRAASIARSNRAVGRRNFS